MKTSQKILIIVDAEHDCSGRLPLEVQKAMRLVTDKKATELTLYCVAFQKYLHHDFLSLDFNQIQRRQEYCDQLAKNLEGLATKLRADGYSAFSDVDWSYPRYESVVGKANAISADLVIQHCTSYGAAELHHLSNDSWQLIRHCPVPLLLIKNHAWKENPVVLAAVDPVHSHNKPLTLDNTIMNAATRLSESIGGQLHVLHAYAEAARPFAPAGVIQTEHRKAIDKLMSAYPVASEQVHFLDETPIVALEMVADEFSADVVVMGAISRSRLSEMLIGSTAEKVIDFMSTDILVIKPAVP
jgi:universal stress protein E